MSLAFLSGEDEQLNEHQIAWMTRDYKEIKKLSKQFKKPKEQALFEILQNATLKQGHRKVESFSDYSQFALNNALSQHVPMAGYAYELNLMNGYISDQMHYDYMYFAIRKAALPRVSFAKISDDWLSRLFEVLVAKYYQVNTTKARAYITSFSDEQIGILQCIVKSTVTDENSEELKFIPTKAERLRVYRTVNDW